MGGSGSGTPTIPTSRSSSALAPPRHSVAALPDGRIVTNGNDGRVRLWDPDHPNQPVDLGHHHGQVSSVVLPDGRIITGGTNGRVRLLDPDQPEYRNELGQLNAFMTTAAVLPDGRIATHQASARVRLWHPDHPARPWIDIHVDASALAASANQGDAAWLVIGDRGVSVWLCPPSPAV